MACGSFLRLFIPKDVKERIASENSKLLKQAQASLGMLTSQMAAGEQGTRRQLEQYEHQQTQAATQTQAIQVQMSHGQPVQAQMQYQMPQQYQQQPTVPQQQYQIQTQYYHQQQPQTQHQQQQYYTQGQQPAQQQTYQAQALPTYQQSQAQYGNTASADENRADCIIS
jgi:hypothetical protein